jgi:TP53 regulating kinase-like protein
LETLKGGDMEAEIKIERLLRKGAEANLFLGSWFGKKALFKHRLPKKYRISVLDKEIRNKRTINEGKALIKVKDYGINVPEVYEINLENSTIIMKYIQGEKLKTLMNSLDSKTKLNYFQELGRQIALLHIHGHIHGDITTSNIIITNSKELFLIDFGLHEYSEKIENKSVDLHLLKRVLISSHGKDSNPCFEAFLEGYKGEFNFQNNNDYQEIIKNISVIETRGRYIKKKDRK